MKTEPDPPARKREKGKESARQCRRSVGLDRPTYIRTFMAAFAAHRRLIRALVYTSKAKYLVST